MILSKRLTLKTDVFCIKVEIIVHLANGAGS